MRNIKLYTDKFVSYTPIPSATMTLNNDNKIEGASGKELADSYEEISG